MNDMDTLRKGLEQLCGSTAESYVQTYLRILPSKRTSLGEFASSVKVEGSHILVTQTHKTTHKQTSKELTVRNVFDISCSNQFVQQKLLSLDNFESALSWTLRGFNTSVVTYGQVCSGKTYTLFGDPQSDFFTFALQQLLQQGVIVALSIWELVQAPGQRFEGLFDLISMTQAPRELSCVEVKSFEEGRNIWDSAKGASANWTDQGFINNRGHLFIRFTVVKEGTVSTMHIVDLAGFLPGQLSPEIRQKLPSDDQITCIRVGLNQLKNAVGELSGGDVDLQQILSSRTSKLVQSVGPLLGGNCRCYLLGTVKEDSEYLGALHTIELLQKAGSIRTKCRKDEGGEIPFKRAGKRPASPLTPRSEESKKWLQDFSSRRLQVMGGASPLKDKYFEVRAESPVLESSLDNPKLSNIKSQINEMLEALERPVVKERAKKWEYPPEDLEISHRTYESRPYPSKHEYSPKTYEYEPAHQDPQPAHDTHQAYEAKQRLYTESYKRNPQIRDPKPPQSPLREYTLDPPPNKLLQGHTQLALMKGEFYVLKNDYEHLLAELRQKELAQARQSALTTELTHQIEELKATFQLQLADLRLQNAQLRQRARLLSESSDGFKVFEQYQEDIARLELQISKLRDSSRPEPEFAPPSGDELDEATILHNKMKRTVKELKGTISGLTKEIKDKERENAELRKKERKWGISQKCLFNVSKKTSQLQNVVGRQNRFLASNEETFHEMIQELEYLKKDNSGLARKLAELTEDNLRMSKDLLVMKDIATSAGLPSETIERLHKNMVSPPLREGKFAVNLLSKLQKELDPRQTQAVDNIKHEVSQLYEALQAASVREENLMCILVDMQEKSNGKDWNKQLRDTLLSTLSY